MNNEKLSNNLNDQRLSKIWTTFRRSGTLRIPHRQLVTMTSQRSAGWQRTWRGCSTIASTQSNSSGSRINQNQ
jgi:hypothetical protein